MTRSLHFTIKINSNHNINNVAIFLGICARIVGFVIKVLANLHYSMYLSCYLYRLKTKWVIFKKTCLNEIKFCRNKSDKK